MARARRCNRQRYAKQHEQPAANTLGPVYVHDQLQRKGQGDEPVDQAADHDASVLDLERVQRCVEEVDARQMVD